MARKGAAQSFVINDWNELAATTLLGDTTKPAVEHILYMAFVQAAVYDAVVGVEGRYAPYRFHAHARHGTSAQAAAVADLVIVNHRLLLLDLVFFAGNVLKVPDGG